MPSPQALTNSVQQCSICVRACVPLLSSPTLPLKLAVSACLSVPDRSLHLQLLPLRCSAELRLPFCSYNSQSYSEEGRWLQVVVMRRLGSVVGMLLLLGAAMLAALSPVAVATARRETLMAASRDEWQGRSGAVDGLGNAPEEPAPPPPAAARISHRRFRSRRIPGSQVQFGGRIPFTADYHNVHRHPPTHN